MPVASSPRVPGALTASADSLALTISTNLASVCGYGAATCPAKTSTVRVTLAGATPTSLGPTNGSVAQVLFVVDLTPYSFGCAYGSYPDGCGYFDAFSHATNALTYFRDHAAALTEAIELAHPGMNLTFGLVETMGTNDSFDDGDGWSYRVDAGQFVNSTDFASLANTSLQPNDLDSSDNLLHSASISALFAALNGVGINWTQGVRHVLVYLGTSAPRAPAYQQDLCALLTLLSCYPPTCEPAGNFSGLELPACEGWVNSTDGYSDDSIAAAARGTTACVTAFAAVCPIDVIDANATPTDPYSPDWLNSSNSSTRHADVWNNTRHVLQAGCDLARATGGTWDGPTWFTCDSLGNGSLAFDASTSTANPTLAEAITNVGLGPANGSAQGWFLGSSGGPLFRFVPTPNVTLAIPLNASVSCLTPSGPFTGCDTVPHEMLVGGVPALAWNWSTDPSTNRLHLGDQWSASFDVVVNASPAASVPLDLCSTPACQGAEGPVETSLGSSAEYKVAGWGSSLTQSFPIAAVEVEPPDPLQAHFTVGPLTGESPFTVNLSVAATGGVPPYAYDWTLPLGTTGSPSGPNLALVVPVAGVFVPQVTITDRLAASLNLLLPVTVLTPVQVVATASPLSAGNASGGSLTGEAPFWVGFSASATDGRAPYVFAWSSGDGQTAPGSAASFTYASAGTYTATLTVTDGLGYAATAAFAVTALPAPPPPPPPLAISAALAGSVVPQAGVPCPGGVAAFSSSVSGGVPPYVVSWQFGDGQGTVGTAPTHLYAPGGTFPATATVRDSSGRANTSTVTVTVPAYGCRTSSATAPEPFLGLLPYLVGAGIAALAGAVGVVAYRVLGGPRRPPTMGRPPPGSSGLSPTRGSLPSSARRPPPPRGGSANR